MVSKAVLLTAREHARFSTGAQDVTGELWWNLVHDHRLCTGALPKAWPSHVYHGVITKCDQGLTFASRAVHFTLIGVSASVFPMDNETVSGWRKLL